MPPGYEDLKSRPLASDAMIELRPLQHFIVKAGLARDADTADRLLAIASIASLIIAFFVWYFFASGKPPSKEEWLQTLSPMERQYYEKGHLVAP